MAANPKIVPRPAKALSASATVLFLICLMYGITYVDRNNVSTVAPIFERDLHLTNTQIGFVYSAFAYPYLIFQIIGGWVSDKFGARLSLTICAIIWGTATSLTVWRRFSAPASCSDSGKARLSLPQRAQ